MCGNIKEEQELHPFWQFLIKLLVTVGMSAAVVLSYGFCLFILMCIGKGVNSAINFLLGG